MARIKPTVRQSVLRTRVKPAPVERPLSVKPLASSQTGPWLTVQSSETIYRYTDVPDKNVDGSVVKDTLTGDDKTTTQRILVGFRIRIGDGSVWFYSVGHGSWTLREHGYQTRIVGESETHYGVKQYFSFVGNVWSERELDPKTSFRSDDALRNSIGHCKLFDVLLAARLGCETKIEKRKIDKNSITAMRKSAGLRVKQRVPAHMQVKH